MYEIIAGDNVYEKCTNVVAETYRAADHPEMSARKALKLYGFNSLQSLVGENIDISNVTIGNFVKLVEDIYNEIFDYAIENTIFSKEKLKSKNKIICRLIHDDSKNGNPEITGLELNNLLYEKMWIDQRLESIKQFEIKTGIK